MWPFKSVAAALPYGDFNGDLAQTRRCLERYSELLQREGLAVQPYTNPSLPLIQRLSPHLQQLSGALSEIAVYAHDATFSGGISRSKQQLWRALSRLELTPTSDFFERITDGNIVEIYSLDHVQLYRSFNFFEFAPITLEEVVGMNWTELTGRDAKISMRALSIALQIRMGLIRETIDLREILPKHRAYWTHRNDLPQLNVEMLWGSPLSKQGQIVAYGTVNNCSFVGSGI